MQRTLLLPFACLLCLSLKAQSLQLPAKSPRAGYRLAIGYTTIEIDYSAPSADGRKIWGAVVPYDSIWRAGANAATAISFSTDVAIDGQPLPAGKYAFLLLPRKDSAWTAIFNRDTTLKGTLGYDPEQDALRVNLKPKFARTVHVERLAYRIERQNIEHGYVLLSWEKLRLYLPVKVETMERAVAEIQEALAAAPPEEEWKVHLQAGEFLLWAGTTGPALQYARQSVSHRETASGYWLLARVHAQRTEYGQAVKAAQQAKALKDAAFERQYGRPLSRKLKMWEAKR